MITGFASSCYYDNKEELYQNYNQADSCDTDSVTYSGFVKSVITTNCAISGCHLSPNPQSGLDLSSYQALKSIAENGKLLNRITGVESIMPPTGPLPSCDIEKIKAWVQAGAHND